MELTRNQLIDWIVRKDITLFRIVPTFINSIESRIKACVDCQLGQDRVEYNSQTNGPKRLTVPGEGNPLSRVLLIGEAPGSNEESQGRPFVGKAGQILDASLKAADLSRGMVFITNVVKCRPERNADPEPTWLEPCKHFLEEQIAAIQPSLIVTLGRFALWHFSPGDSLTYAHGLIRDVGNYKVYPMYHPAAISYRPQLKDDFDQDWWRLRNEVLPNMIENFTPPPPPEIDWKNAPIPPGSALDMLTDDNEWEWTREVDPKTGEPFLRGRRYIDEGTTLERIKRFDKGDINRLPDQG